MPVGKKIKMYYDPRGNVIRTVNPDNSEQWVVHGKPNILNSVAVENSWSFKNYVPTPWESYTYDADDLALITNGTSYGHDFTPKSATVDALGRTVKTIDRLSQSASDDVVMKYQYDVRGNLLKVTDALNRIAFTYAYDLRPQPKKEEGGEEKKLPPISTWHIDSGNKKNISDVTGKAIELDDAKGAQVLSGYDTISRPINIWEKDKTGETTTLRQHLIYGDSAGLPSPVTNNYLGKLYQQYDEAGLQQINNYDFKGNITDKFRKVISDATLLSVFDGSTIDCYRVDWTNLNTSILDSAEHQTNSVYDALNRVTELIYPEDVTGKWKVLLPTYNNAGALDSVILKDNISGTPTTYVNHIAYNAKGQRILIAFGNTVMTRYAYDKRTFRLKRQRTETYTQTGWTFAGAGSVKQDTAYQYDLIGNILATNEATTGSGVGGLNNLLRQFTYDDLYRLLSANGRENAPTITPIWDDSYRSTDDSTTTAYTQNYQYDKMGNILQLQHTGASNFTRNFNYNTATNNQLQSVDIGLTNYAFSYDANGNQLTETANRKMEWDAADRMRSFYIEASGSITKYTQYLYDAGGNRVKKLTWVQGGSYDSSTYIDGFFEYRTDGTDEQNTLHVMDDKSRIVTIRIGDDFGDITPAIKYNLEDHLGSSTIQLETNGANVNKEEYYPFGETSFGSYAKKRYKYCGKERDDESGLYYYGARYYNAWCCRFVSVDPLKDKYAHLSAYNYASNNPATDKDVNGMENPTEGNSPSGENGINASQEKGKAGFYIITSNVDTKGEKALQDIRESLGKDRYYEGMDYGTGKPIQKERITVENIGDGLFKVNFNDQGLVNKGVYDDAPDFANGNAAAWLMYKLTNSSKAFSYQVTSSAEGTNGRINLYSPSAPQGPVDMNFSYTSRGSEDSTGHIIEKVYQKKVLTLENAVTGWNLFNSKPTLGFNAQAFTPPDINGVYISKGTSNASDYSNKDLFSRGELAIHSLAEVYAREALNYKIGVAHEWAAQFDKAKGKIVVIGKK